MNHQPPASQTAAKQRRSPWRYAALAIAPLVTAGCDASRFGGLVVVLGSPSCAFKSSASAIVDTPLPTPDPDLVGRYNQCMVRTGQEVPGSDYRQNGGYATPFSPNVGFSGLGIDSGPSRSVDFGGRWSGRTYTIGE